MVTFYTSGKWQVTFSPKQLVQLLYGYHTTPYRPSVIANYIGYPISNAGGASDQENVFKIFQPSHTSAQFTPLTGEKTLRVSTLLDDVWYKLYTSLWYFICKHASLKTFLLNKIPISDSVPWMFAIIWTVPTLDVRSSAKLATRSVRQILDLKAVSESASDVQSSCLAKPRCQNAKGPISTSSRQQFLSYTRHCNAFQWYHGNQLMTVLFGSWTSSRDCVVMTTLVVGEWFCLALPHSLQYV